MGKTLINKIYNKWPIEHFYIYLLVNDTGQEYVGISTTPHRRLTDHTFRKTLSGRLSMPYIRYVGNIWRALDVEAALQSLDNKSIIEDEAKFIDWMLRIPPTNLLSYSPNVRYLYRNTVMHPNFISKRT
jgi:predicted GIY-YIG superfamily endonuclease